MTDAPTTQSFDLARPRRVHLVGIGGAGMSGIARLLLQRGHHVSGSDLKEGRALEVLRALGAVVQAGHAAEAVGDAEVVVISTAVRADNPEVVEAKRRGLPVLRRAEMLAALTVGSRAVLVAGTHGKTTTTSMIAVALQAAGEDPSFAIGGNLNETGSNAHAGSGDAFIAEADESDRSFLVYTPDVAVVTNVELDHPDEYATDADVDDVFLDFLARRSAGAPAIICTDDAGGARLADRVEDVISYGENGEADVRLIVDAGGAARVRIGERSVVLRLPVPGRHNQLNATAALAVCHALGADLDRSAEGLASFTGAQRRFQRLGEVDGVQVVDDYAHHPTELRATLAAARSTDPGRVVVVVQPHRYSRTAVFGEDLGRAAAAADIVVVTEVYASSEEPVPGVSGHLVADAAADAGAKVVWEPHLGSVAARLAELVVPGDLVLITGAGDVTQVGPALLEELRTRRA